MKMYIQLFTTNRINIIRIKLMNYKKHCKINHNKKRMSWNRATSKVIANQHHKKVKLIMMMKMTMISLEISLLLQAHHQNLLKSKPINNQTQGFKMRESLGNNYQKQQKTLLRAYWVAQNGIWKRQHNFWTSSLTIPTSNVNTLYKCDEAHQNKQSQHSK